MPSPTSIFTTAVHSGQIQPKPGTPSTPPIVTASGWDYVDLETLDAALGDDRAGYAYARNAAPTQEAFEAAVNTLENGQGAAAFASGMAALYTALLVAGAQTGAHIIAATELYGKTQTLLDTLAAQTGVTVQRVNIRDLPAVEKALAGAPINAPRSLLFEIISNPLCRVADAPALVALARRYQAKVIIDSSFTTPYLARPVEFGADFVAHSVTKYLSGHGDVLGGVTVAAAPEQAAALRAMRGLIGANLSPFDAYLALRGLRTLALRVREQNRNAHLIAEWLAGHPRIARVYYAGLPTNADHAVARRFLREGCFGAMLAFDVKDAGTAEIYTFMRRLKIIRRVPTLGDITTLVMYPARASHRYLPPEQRAALGIGEGCVRLSAGIEAAEDLIADLEQALA